jgi:transcriptional regulator with XRE-family HTH domain
MTIWARKIADLEASGRTLADIATAIGLTAAAVSELKQGRSKQPRGNAALKLIELHECECARAA